MPQRLSFFCYATKFGTITLQASEKGITAVAFGVAHLDGTHSASALLNDAATQLQEYFAGKRYRFELPLDIHPTPFQERVWAEISRIPYGETRTSKQIAVHLGNESAFRSVGRAVRENPVALLIPSHRIEVPVGSTFKLADVYRGLQAFERSIMQ